MTCRSCASEYQTEVLAEINIHFPKSDGAGDSDILLFRSVVLCLHCGLAEFSLSEYELNRSAVGGSS